MKNGGSAFPILDTTSANDINSLACVDEGMKLRDYFAGQVLAGVTGADGVDWLRATPEQTAEACYKFADAMLAEREKSLSEG